MPIRVVAGLERERSYAFRPSSLEADGVHVWFRRKKILKWSWRHLQRRSAVFVNEIWTYDGDDFEPGNCWTEWENPQ